MLEVGVFPKLAQKMNSLNRYQTFFLQLVVRIQVSIQTISQADRERFISLAFMFYNTEVLGKKIRFPLEA